MTEPAAIDGRDLRNLNIGDSMSDDNVRDAVNVARSMGSVCATVEG